MREGDDMSERDRRDFGLLKKLEVNGVVTPENVVAAASRKNHPWHDCFEWNDGKAAGAYRLDQAREIIRRVQVRIVREQWVTFRPAYVRQPDRPRQSPGYVEVGKVADQKAMAAKVLADELARIAGNLERARGLALEFGMSGDFEAMLASVGAIRERLKLAA